MYSSLFQRLLLYKCRAAGGVGQPVCLPPTIYLSKKQIQSQTNSYSKSTKESYIYEKKEISR
jgi:hypothetical protein